MTSRNSARGTITSGWEGNDARWLRGAVRAEDRRWKMRKAKAMAAALGAVLWIAGCGTGSGSGSTNLKSATIAPTSATVPLGQTFDFQVTVNLINSSVNTTTAVSWEVNSIAGGNATIGTITPASTDSDVGVYQAPLTNPNQTITVTAVITQTNSTASTPPTVTSNSATVTLGTGLGLQVTPTGATVPAGGRQQFTALLNSVQDPAATWSISSPSGSTDASVIGSIGLTGVYTAPTSPPPGGTITVTASDGAATANATVTVVYSDVSLEGPYAFSYTGNDQSGYLAAAGSFLADGQGHITSGVEDVDSFLNGVAIGVPISGTYTIGNDGRGKATITRGQITETWRFALTNGQHAQLMLAGYSSTNATGGGTIDQQSVAALSNSSSVISGPYVFTLLGADGSTAATPYAPRGLAGEFSANGAGSIPAASGTLLDVNDNGSISPADTSLSGMYSFDTSNPGTGRGTITLLSNSTGGTALKYAFYAVSTAVDPATNASYVTQMHVIEIDGKDAVAGDIFSAPPASALGSGNLPIGNYAFTYGGSSASGAYAAGGVLTSNGTSVTGGVLDINNAVTATLNTSISGCTSSPDATKRRIDLTCTAGGSTPEFAVYQTSLGSAVMLELDPAAVATGTAYAQCGPASAGCADATPSIGSKSVALGLIGQGIFHSSPASYQQDIDGQISLGSGAVTPGSIDINNFTGTFAGDPISTVSLGSASSLGRGTTVVTASKPSATYNLIYYLIDDQTALVFDQDQTYVLRGSFVQQY
jgi:hypothetical protein